MKVPQKLLQVTRSLDYWNLSVQASQSRDELYYTDNSGSVIQLTYSGSIGGQNLSPASGSEVKTGYTFDGYPVYRQFFSGSGIAHLTVLETEVRDIVRTGGWVCHSSYDYTRYVVPVMVSSTVYFYIRINSDNSLVALVTTSFNQKDYRFFVEYTKL